MHFRKLIAALAVTGATLFASLPAPAVPFSNLVVFGDSLSDTGNNAWIFDNVVGPTIPVPPGTLRTATPIPGPDFVPTFPYASDRYSNGPVWAEGFASTLGLSAQASLLGGTNFAFGGARVGPLGSPFPFSLRDQVAGFLAATGGIAPADALYVLFGGGNDARDVAQTALGGGNPLPLIDAFADNMAFMVNQLRNAGASHVLLANVPDIGKTPSIQALAALDPGIPGAVSGLVALMNQALDAELAALPGLPAGMGRLDVFGLLNEVFLDPAAFGLTDSRSACAFLCPDGPADTFFWDGIHPTTAGHAVLAAAALRALPEPGMVAVFMVGLVMLVLVRRRLV